MILIYLEKTGSAAMERRDGISPHNIVDAQLADYVAGDAERFASHYAIDSVCVRLPEGELIASGRSEIARVWGHCSRGEPLA